MTNATSLLSTFDNVTIREKYNGHELTTEEREFAQLVARSLSQFGSAMMFAQTAIAIIGCICNLFVIQRLCGIIKARPCLNPAYYLLAMCCADVFCSVSLVTYWETAAFIFKFCPFFIKLLFCKASMFTVHVASAFRQVVDFFNLKLSLKYSTWCWMLLSLHRYVAMFHPSKFRERVWYVRPLYSLIAILFLSFLVELWIPLSTTFGRIEHQFASSTKDCIEKAISPTVTMTFQAIEILVTFVIPACILIYLDFAVKRYQKEQCSQSRRAAIAFAIARGSAETDVDEHIRPLLRTTMTRYSLSKRMSSLWPKNARSEMSTAALNPQTPNTLKPSIQHHRCSAPAITHIEESNRSNDATRDSTTINDQLRVPSLAPSTDLYTHTTVNRARRTRHTLVALKRYIKLTGFDLMLATPHICTRLLHSFGWFDAPGPLPYNITWFISSTVINHVAYMMYYTQFSINLLFLWVLYRENVVRLSRNRKP